MNENKKDKDKSLWENKSVLRITALLLALLLWIISAGFVFPKNTKTLPNVPVNFKRGESNYKGQQLEIVGDIALNGVTVSVTVQADPSVVANITADDILIYLDYSVVSGEGSYQVPLRAEVSSYLNFDVVSIKPDRIDLRFAETDRRTLPLEVRADGVTALDGFFRDTPRSTVAEITVSGPQDEISRVARAVATVTNQEERSDSKYYAGVPVKLYDNDGVEIDARNLTLSTTEVEVYVPILEVREIPIQIEFTGYPRGYDIEWLRERMNLSTTSIRVAGKPADLDALPTVSTVEYIDLSNFDLDEPFPPLNISLDPNKYTNLDNIKQVTVTFNTYGLAQRTFSVSNLRVVNTPAGFSVTPVSSGPINVTLIGPENVLNALLPEDIIIEVEAGNIGNTRGQQTLAARIIVPKSSQVFAVGRYQVLCDVGTA